MSIIHRNTDYAIRSLIRLRDEGRVMPVAELAEACEVPVDFLRKIMQKLNAAGMVNSVQGPSGGYELVGAPERISLLDVVECVQGPIRVNACFDDPSICDNVRGCGVRARLEQLGEEMECLLDRITMDELQQRVNTE
ncbi:MAG: RrF2 family transcriptional regulator [Planctomycetota bacterium]